MPPEKIPVYDRRGGFTLLEILVAVTISVVVFSTAYAVLRSALDTYRDQDDRNYFNQNLRAAWRPVSRDLRCTFPTTGDFRFRGESGRDGDRALDRVTFVTYMPASGSRAGGLSGISYYVDTDPLTPEQGLVRDEYGFPLRGSRESSPVRRALAPLVTSLALRYFDGESWHEEWGTRENAADGALPVAVRITVTAGGYDTPYRETIITTEVPVFTGSMPSQAGL